MEDLIKALQILLKYSNDTEWPTHCEHDELWITCVNPADVSNEDIKRLDELGFHIDENHFKSYRFGSS